MLLRVSELHFPSQDGAKVVDGLVLRDVLPQVIRNPLTGKISPICVVVSTLKHRDGLAERLRLKHWLHAQFAELELRATICPGQCGWPKPEYVHWLKLHEAANEARARVNKACIQMDEIDRNADLPRDDKYRERSKIATQAIDDFEASKTLARTCQAVELAVAQHAQDHEAMLKAKKEVERGWQRAMDRIAERAGLTKIRRAIL